VANKFLTAAGNVRARIAISTGKACGFIAAAVMVAKRQMPLRADATKLSDWQHETAA
jgi:hypothetical protein